MGEYIGVRNFCSLCKHGKMKSEDKHGKLNPEQVVCENKESCFYNYATTGILCAPCFQKKELERETKIEYVGFGD